MNVTIKKPPFSSNKRVVKIRIWWRWTNAVQVENGIENNEIMRDGRKAMIFARVPSVMVDHQLSVKTWMMITPLSLSHLNCSRWVASLWLRCLSSLMYDRRFVFDLGVDYLNPLEIWPSWRIFGDAKTIPVSGVLAHRKYFGASLPSPNVHWQRVNKPFDSHVKTSGFDRNNTHVEMWKEQLTLL